jgi:hypothetical protein
MSWQRITFPLWRAARSRRGQGEAAACRRSRAVRPVVDGLEARQLLSLAFDFGRATSPLAAGYTRATADRFDATLGYGWTAGRPGSVNRQIADPLRTDWVGTSDGAPVSFGVTLPNGTYDVTLMTGDYYRALNDMGVTLEGALAGTITTAPRQYLYRTYRTTVTDGRLDLTLDTPDGAAYNAFVNAMTIAPAADSGYNDVYVGTDEEFADAINSATPGTRILVQPGTYRGGYFLTGVQGTADRHIVIDAADPSNKPVFRGGANCFLFRTPAYLEVRNLILESPNSYGISIDDGGDYANNPAHDVTLSGLEIRNAGSMGFKLAGLDNFLIENCTITNPSFMGIDMVGCHDGVIERSTVVGGATTWTGIAGKGGSKDITIRDNLLRNCGWRSIEIGGATERQYFRPSFQGYEAKDFLVEGNVIVGSKAPIVFGSSDGGVFRYNTIYRPTYHLLRILQDNDAPDVVPTRNGVVTDNIFVFRRSEIYASEPINISYGTAPETFQFARNWWYAMDDPSRSRPNLPTEEVDGHYGIDPQLVNPQGGDFHVRAGSPAEGAGAYAPH